MAVVVNVLFVMYTSVAVPTNVTPLSPDNIPEIELPVITVAFPSSCSIPSIDADIMTFELMILLSAL